LGATLMGTLARLIGIKDWEPPVPGWQPPIEPIWGSEAGLAVSAESAMRLSAVWACVRLLAENIASLPLKVFRDEPVTVSSGRVLPNRVPARDTAAYQVLHERANPRMTAYVWKETGIGHEATWGNHYSEIVRDDQGNLAALWPLRPDRIEVKLRDDERRYGYRDPFDNTMRWLDEADVFHVPHLGFDGLIGYSVLRNHRNTIGLAQSVAAFSAAKMKNHARPATVVEYPKKVASADVIERLSAQMDRLRGSANAGKTVVLEDGAHFGVLPSEDADYIELAKLTRQDIYQIFGVPPHMVGDVDRSTSWGSGIEQQTIGFVTFVLRPYLIRWEQEINTKLLSNRPDLHAEFELDGLLRGDTATRTAHYVAMRNIGGYNANDILVRENQPPRLDEGGEEYWKPLNTEGQAATETVEFAPVEDGGRPRVLSLPRVAVDAGSRNGGT
jgi:HK97 family phage portal protein